MNNHLLSAAIGDICGSVYEHLPIKDYNGVDLRNPHHYYTDDTVCTFAVAEALMYDLEIAQTLRSRCREDLYRGYGAQFLHWLIMADDVEPPYNSSGNGSAMRVSAAGFMARDKQECIRLATKTAAVTHNHPEGIKGAVATALVIFYAMQGKDKDFIRNNVLKKYYPDWNTLSYSDIKKDYCFDESSQRTVPAAIISFLESNNYEDCLKLAISLGGDADTLGAIAGPMAYAFYKEMPQELIDNAVNLLPAWILDINYAFDQHMNTKD